MKTRFPWQRTAGATFVALATALTAQQTLAQDNSVGLEEVVVTAQRRTTNLQETPISITAINSERIEETHAADIKDLSEIIPNLTVTPGVYGDAAPNITIRGVGGGQGLQSFGAAGERNIAMYIDGLYYPRSFGSVMRVTEVAGVEVLRGPQGTLFGRNTTGGAINYTSKKASVADGFSGFAQVDAGNQGTLAYKANVNIPMGDNWAMLLGAGKAESDGYIERNGGPLNNTDNVAGILNVHGELDSLTLDFNYSYSDSESNGMASTFTELSWTPLAGDPTSGLRGHLGALSQAFLNVGQPALGQNDSRLLMGPDKVAGYCLLDDMDPDWDEACRTYRLNEMNVWSVKAQYALNDNIKLTSLTGSVKTDVDTRTDSYYTGGYARDFAQQSTSLQQEFQVNFDYERWNAVAGLVYFNEDAEEQELTTERLMTGNNNPAAVNPVTGLPVPISTTTVLRSRRSEQYKYETDSYAAYGQANVSLTSWWELTGGVRYSEDKKEGHIFHRPLTNANRIYADGEKKWTSTDYRASMQFRPWDDGMFFVSHAKAFKAGIANDSTAEAGVSGSPTGEYHLPMLWANPEEVVATEIGARTEWLDNRFRLNLTYFDQDWEGRHTSDSTTVDGFLVITTINSPGIINIKGYEIESSFQVADPLTVNFSYGRTDAESNVDPGFVLDSVPRYNYTVGLRYTVDSLLGGSLSTSADYNYRATQYTFSTDEPDKDDPGLAPGYGVYNANLRYTHDSGKWSVSLYGRNLEDKRFNYGAFAISGYANPSFAGNAIAADPRVAMYGPPRSFGATFRYNF